VTNRRNDYRHGFAPDDRLRVEQSVGGLAVDFDDANVRPDPSAAVFAHFAIPHGLRRFALPAALERGTG
jgi:hypothetical protein